MLPGMRVHGAVGGAALGWIAGRGARQQGQRRCRQGNHDDGGENSLESAHRWNYTTSFHSRFCTRDFGSSLRRGIQLFGLDDRVESGNAFVTDVRANGKLIRFREEFVGIVTASIAK